VASLTIALDEEDRIVLYRGLQALASQLIDGHAHHLINTQGERGAWKDLWLELVPQINRIEAIRQKLLVGQRYL